MIDELAKLEASLTERIDALDEQAKPILQRIRELKAERTSIRSQMAEIRREEKRRIAEEKREAKKQAKLAEEEKVRRLRESGLTWREVGEAMGPSIRRLDFYKGRERAEKARAERKRRTMEARAKEASS